MLAAYSEDTIDSAIRTPRIYPQYETTPQFIINNTKQYQQQYAGIYFTRLNILRQRTIAACKFKWSVDYIPKILDVQIAQSCFIVGTIYKDMSLKPSVLDKVAREQWIIAPPPREKYICDSDSILLEDESGRMKLSGDFLKTLGLITGTVVGLMGVESSGEFVVQDICYPQCEPQSPITNSSEGSFIALVSGFDIGNNSGYDLPMQLSLDFLTGELPQQAIITKDMNLVRHISRLVIAGNSVQKLMSAKETRNHFGHEVSTFNGSPIRLFDTAIHQVCMSLDVDMMPGSDDPVSIFLPQQPIHPCLMPKSSSLSTFHNVTNPHSFQIDGTDFLGTSGQNIDDIYKYVESESRLEIAERTLRWSHIAPTAPDTILCHPFKDTDPFVLEKKPHVYFIGNQPKFETKIVQWEDGSKTRIILIPKFSEFQMMILVHNQTLEFKCARIKKIIMTLLVADVYDIVGFIASGTYGRVFKATRKNTTFPYYAIKKFKPDKDPIHGISISAIREIAICKEMKNQNVVQLIHIILDHSLKSISMVFEYAEYDLLSILHHHASVLKSAPIPEYTIKSFLWQLLNGLHYLHLNYIMHRDLKPANILVNSNGVIKIADLGLARIYHEPLQPLTIGDRVVVTIWYRAPELLLGSHHYTQSIDLWAAGCIFAELIILKPFFKGEEINNDKKGIVFQKDQMKRIIQVLGCPTVDIWPALEFMPDCDKLSEFKGQKTNYLWNFFNRNFPSKSVLGYQLLSMLLNYNCDERISTNDALDHPFFKEMPLPGLNSLVSPYSDQKFNYPLRHVVSGGNESFNSNNSPITNK